MTDGSSAAGAADDIVTVDRLIRHISTVPAAAGQELRLFVREKAPAAIAHGADGRAPEGRVVLMVHGGFWPCVPPYDLDHPGYSWMAALAGAGFDAFAMDMTGYGYSSRPMMDDPANLSADDRAALFPNLPAAHAPSWPRMLVDSDSETADIDRVVDYIRELRGVERISLIGWSGGGIRSGTYTVRHPEKIDRLVIFASSNYARDGASDPPADMPPAGHAINFQSWSVGLDARWRANVHCDGQVAPGIAEIVLQQSAATDPVGASWGTGGLRAPSRTYWGWNRDAAAAIDRPTLVMVGEFDRLLPSNIELFDDLGARRKAFLHVRCASHFMVWEKQRRVLHDASLEWLRDETLRGAATGRFEAGENGVIGKA